MHLRNARRALCCALVLSVAGCGDHAAKSNAGPTAKSALPETYWSATEPAGAKNVLAAKEGMKAGDELVVVGRVGGGKEVFSEGRAIFSIVDPSFKPCGADSPMPECETPWDYCCDDPASLRKATVAVEFREGKDVLKTSARGFHGLDHLKTVVVKGKAEKDAEGNVTVVASSVFVRN